MIIKLKRHSPHCTRFWRINNMKKFTTHILIAAFSGALWGLAESPILVTYSQVFADKQITITEEIKIWQCLTITTKEGFIKYE